MKIKYKLSIWLIILMAFVVIIVATILIRQVSAISYYLSVRSLGQLTSQHVEYWKGREDGYIRTLHTLASVMGDYESLKAEERRDRYDDMLRSALEAEPQMIALYTVWKPNAIDNMDDHYIKRVGSSTYGQYAIAFFKEPDKIAGRTSGDINNIIAHINGPNAAKDRVENPSFLKIRGKNTLIIKLSVPIFNHKNNKVVGGLGCYLSVDAIQNIVENTMKINNEIAMMAMYSGNGTIMAHYMPERIGKRMLDIDLELGDSRQDLFRAMQIGKPFMETVYQPETKEKILYLVKPFQIGNSGHNWSMLLGIPESYLLKEAHTMTQFTVVLILTAILVTALIIFIIVEFITKPIVRVTDLLKDISEGKGDLTQLIDEEGNDEITDMSKFFNLTLKKIKSLIMIIKQQAAVLSDTQNELSGNMSQTAVIVTQITANLKTVKSRLIDQNLSTAQTGIIMEQITNSVDKLKEYIDQHTSNTAQSSFASVAFKSESDGIQDGSHEAVLESKYLEMVNQEITAKIKEIANGTDQINTAVLRANEISEKNKANINILVRGVSMFKVA